ncbi:hypothetical protein JAAARDRAFT_551536 [Jaapia argillacea MUCL 33604]|uniref:Uncharacterized protein n=1 Tax=Jaapia argillacea MUCL 33604 TaxID=933084 RepID=A0A067PJX3_9AGAM|nr:hypothetical protein JAAARDRAFT_551536 [Jaapia argillacea MUCL 33604]
MAQNSSSQTIHKPWLQDFGSSATPSVMADNVVTLHLRFNVTRLFIMDGVDQIFWSLPWLVDLSSGNTGINGTSEARDIVGKDDTFMRAIRLNMHGFARLRLQRLGNSMHAGLYAIIPVARDSLRCRSFQRLPSSVRYPKYAPNVMTKTFKSRWNAHILVLIQSRYLGFMQFDRISLPFSR